MKLSFVACLSLFLKCVSGAGLKNLDDGQLILRFSEGCSLSEFQGIVGEIIERVSKGLFGAVPDMSQRTIEQRVWYYAKWYGTLWCTTMVSEEELNANVPSIIMADNPSVLASLSLDLRKKVLDPVNLISYDAIELAKTLPDLLIFEKIIVEVTHSNTLRLARFLKERGITLTYNPNSAITSRNVVFLQSLIDERLWTPCMNDLNQAIQFWKPEDSVLFLLEKLRGLPSINPFECLFNHRNSNSSRYIRSYNPTWTMSQENVDKTTTLYQGEKVLEWHVSINPSMPRPSHDALRVAYQSKSLGIFEWFLSTYYSECVALFQPTWELQRDYIQDAVKQGYIHVVKWHASFITDMPLLKTDTLLHVCFFDRLEILQLYDSVGSAWTLSQKHIDAAVEHGSVRILEWYGGINPTMPRPSATSLRGAVNNNCLQSLKWYVTVDSDWRLSEEYIKRCIQWGHINILKWHTLLHPSWTMTQEHVDIATQYGHVNILQLQYDLGHIIIQPSEEIWNATCSRGHSSVLKWFTKIGLGRSLSQEDIEVATLNEHLHVLQWGASVDPDMPLPSKVALEKVILNSGNVPFFEWLLTKYPQNCAFLPKSGCNLYQSVINSAADRGCVHVLNWAARISANGIIPRLAVSGLNNMCTSGRCEDLKWYVSVTPGWTLTQDEVDTATTRGYVGLLECYSSINPHMHQPSVKALYIACRIGRLGVFEWFLSKYHNDSLLSFQPGWTLNPVEIDIAAEQGCIRVLEWNAFVDPTVPPPSSDSLKVALQNKFFNVYGWSMNKYQSNSYDTSILLLALKNTRIN